MGSQSSKLANESQQKKQHLVQLSGQQNQSQAVQQINVQKNDQIPMVNTFFKWGFSANSVYVTGTFTNWKNHIQLQRQGQEFSVCVRLPCGIYQYKFIVDGEWHFSPEDNQTIDENGNINNLIDTSNYNPNESDYLKGSNKRPVAPFEHQDKNASLESSDFNKLSLSSTNPISSPNSNSNKAYQNTIELQSERYGLYQPQTKKQTAPVPEFNFKDRAPVCPPHLMDVYFLKQKEYKLLNRWRTKPYSNNDEVECEEEIKKQKKIEMHQNILRYFDSDHSLAPPQHVTTKHVGLKNLKNNSYNVYCITQRFKQKYTTFKYFTSQQVQNADQLFVA